MEDAVGGPARKHRALPPVLREAEARHLVVEVEIEHLWLVDGHIGFLGLGRERGILNRYRRGISSSAGNCSHILRPRVTEAARQSVAEPFGHLDLKRVIPPVAIVLVIVANAAELRVRPKRLSQAVS